MPTSRSMTTKHPLEEKKTKVKQPCSDLVKSITEILHNLSPITQNCSIYRIPKRLLNICYKSYTPQVISIGPFHHGRPHVVAMEQLKHRFLSSYLCRTNTQIEVAVENAKSWETDARSYYADPINMESHKFVKMMLVDGCFIVELMIMVYGQFPESHNRSDPLLFMLVNHIIIDLYRDLTMLENQLPFFVLENIFNLYLPSTKISFKALTHHFFFANNFFVKGLVGPHLRYHEHENVRHFVNFLSLYYTPLKDHSCISETISSENENQPNLPPTASELCEAGVVFQKAIIKGKHIMDINFKNGILEIPHFKIEDAFERHVRNLMAFEQLSIGNKKYVTHCVAFLDALISTEKDVSLLLQAKIITNHIGGCNEEISKLFHNLCREVILASDCHYLDNISKDLRDHCMRRENRWMASLRRDYNTPWAFISFIAATLLLVLTLLQTIFSGLSLCK